MQRLTYLVPLLLLCLMTLGACKAKKKKDDGRSKNVTSKKIKSISDEYKRLDQKCNELEVLIGEYALNGDLSARAKENIQGEFRQMKLAVMNLQSEFKASILTDTEVNNRLLKKGLDAAIIEELINRLTRLEDRLNMLLNDDDETSKDTSLTFTNKR